MYRIYSLLMFLLAIPNVDQLVHAVYHIPPATSDAQMILEADGHGISEHLQATDDDKDAKVYWTLSTWQGKSDSCATPADKEWTDWVYHPTCERYNFNQLRFDPGKDGIYRLCVYAARTCSDLVYETSSGKNCVEVKHPWGKSWTVIKARENC